MWLFQKSPVKAMEKNRYFLFYLTIGKKQNQDLHQWFVVYKSGRSLYTGVYFWRKKSSGKRKTRGHSHTATAQFCPYPPLVHHQPKFCTPGTAVIFGAHGWDRNPHFTEFSKTVDIKKTALFQRRFLFLDPYWLAFLFVKKTIIQILISISRHYFDPFFMRKIPSGSDGREPFA